MQRTIELPPMARGTDDDFGLELRSDSFDQGSNSIEVIWSTGARVRRRSWIDGVFDEELSMDPNHIRLDRLNRGAPFLDSHDGYSLDSVLGSVVAGTAKIENGRGLARVNLSRADRHAGIIENIKAGVIRNISVGYKIYRIEEKKDGDVPLRRVLDWEPFEISAVAVPADPAAQVRSAKTSQEERSPCALITPDSSVAIAARMRMRAAQMLRA